MLNNTHDICDTISNIFCPYLRDLRLKFWEIYYKCSNSVNFWARKMFFFLNGSEIDWYHYQGASPAPSCIVRHQTMPKTRLSVTSEPSVCVWVKVDYICDPCSYCRPIFKNGKQSWKLIELWVSWKSFFPKTSMDFFFKKKHK